MAVSEGLFQSQDQAAQSLDSAPGWTIDEQKPQFWDNFGLLPAMTGIGAGLANGISVLAKGLQFSEDPRRAPNQMGVYREPGELQPWQKKANDVLEDISTQAHAGAKGLMPDPRTTGTAANLVNGFARSVTEFGAGALAGGPEVGAGILGTTEGYARYHDLRDQGVDEKTALRSAWITGAANAAGALTPFRLPGKLLEPLSTAGTFLAQAGAGATINTTLGAGSRLADSMVLRHAGYPEMADQVKPWDETNVATDALTGAFFGAHAAFSGLKDTAVGPAVRDAAKVVQDRQEVLDRAPGVPVDMASAAIHRDALESALGDLLQGKPVSLDDRVNGATFARPEEDTTLERQIMREEFEKAGVLRDAEEFDQWLKGEAPRAPEPEDIITPESARVTPETAEVPETAAPEIEEGMKEDSSEPADAAVKARPDLEIPQEGEPVKAADALESARAQSAQADAEAEKAFTTAVNCGARYA